MLLHPPLEQTSSPRNLTVLDLGPRVKLLERRRAPCMTRRA